MNTNTATLTELKTLFTQATDSAFITDADVIAIHNLASAKTGLDKRSKLYWTAAIKLIAEFRESSLRAEQNVDLLTNDDKEIIETVNFSIVADKNATFTENVAAIHRLRERNKVSDSGTVRTPVPIIEIMEVLRATNLPVYEQTGEIVSYLAISPYYPLKRHTIVIDDGIVFHLNETSIWCEKTGNWVRRYLERRSLSRTEVKDFRRLTVYKCTG